MRPFAWFVSLMLTVSAHIAQAQDEAGISEAYQKAENGLKAFKAGQFSQALDDYTRAYAIVHLPALAVHIARANVALGNFVAALRFYDEATKLPDGVGDPQVQARARAEAQAESIRLLPRIPKIVFRTSGVALTSIRLQVDGAEIPIEAYEPGWLVDPGSHQVTARFGSQQQGQWVAVSEGEVRELRFAFSVPAGTARIDSGKQNAGNTAPATTSLTRRVAWVSMGIGGAGLLVWGTAGVVALKKSGELKSLHCGANASPCPASELRSYNGWKTAATVGFYTGAAALLTGTTLLLLEPNQKRPRESAARVVPWVGIGSAGFEGHF